MGLNIVLLFFVLTFKWKQDDENALLQQALAMSMDDSAISHDVKDTDMSEASASDPDLALGEFLCYSFSLHLRNRDNDMGHNVGNSHCNTVQFKCPNSHEALKCDV